MCYPAKTDLWAIVGRGEKHGNVIIMLKLYAEIFFFAKETYNFKLMITVFITVMTCVVCSCIRVGLICKV